MYVPLPMTSGVIDERCQEPRSSVVTAHRAGPRWQTCWSGGGCASRYKIAADPHKQDDEKLDNNTSDQSECHQVGYQPNSHIIENQ